MANWGNIFKWGFILTVILGILGVLLFNYYDIGVPNNNQNITINETARLPQCIDGIDNDGDGFIDFGDLNKNDPDCTSASDNWERDFTIFYWVGGIILAIGLSGLSVYLYMKYKDNKKDDDFFKDPVGPERGWVLARSYFIDKYVDDILCMPLSKKEISVSIPYDKFAIYELDRLPDKDQKTGEYFQYSFFRVTKGRMIGDHVMIYSMSKGEEHIMKGVERVELNVTRDGWKKLSRTFHMSSIQDKKDRLAYYLSETASDEELKKFLLSEDKSSSSTSQYDELDDEEFSTVLRQKAMQNTTKKKKKSGSNNNALPYNPNLGGESIDE